MAGTVMDDTVMTSSQLDVVAKVAVIENKLFGQDGLIAEVKEIRQKIDRFAFLWVAGCFAVGSSLTAAVLTHTL